MPPHHLNPTNPQTTPSQLLYLPKIVLKVPLPIEQPNGCRPFTLVLGNLGMKNQRVLSRLTQARVNPGPVLNQDPSLL